MRSPPRRYGGEDDATHAAPTTICAHGGINWNGEWEDNDAARRVATSSEKRENRFKPPYSKRGTAAKGP